MNIAQKIMEIYILTETMVNSCPKDMPITKLKVLSLLYECKFAEPQFLIGKLGLKKPNLTKVCSELLADNFIVKLDNNHDKRGILYKITKLGEEKISQLLQSINKRFWDDSKNTSTVNTLQTLSEVLNKKI